MANNLTEGSPARVILSFSLPIIIGNVFQQIYNFADTVIVGRFVNYQALAGVGITGGLTFLILGFVWGITAGLGIRTAQLVGARDAVRVRRSVGTSLVICLFLTVFLTLIALLTVRPMLNMMQTGPEIYEYARVYLVIVFSGIYAQVAFNMISCILRALGDSRTPLYFLILSSVMNVILDLLFIVKFGWGVKGAGIATVLSQVASAALCFRFAFNRYPEIRLSSTDFRLDWPFAWEHLRLGFPMAFQFSITALGIVILQAALNGFPSTYIAGFTAAGKVQNLCVLIPISFGVAIASYAGQNYGAGKIDRVRRGVNVTLVMILCVCVVMSTVMVVFATPFTSLFIDSSTDAADMVQIYEASRKYLYVSALFFPFLYMIFLYRNALQGVGKTFWPLMAGVLELVIRTVSSMILPGIFGYNGIVMVDVLSWLGACIMLMVSYFIQMPKENPVP